MENQDKLYEQFKDAAHKAESKGFDRMETVWNRLEDKLDNNKQRRLTKYWKYAGIAAMFLLFIGVGTFMFMNEGNKNVAPKGLPENNVTTLDTQKIKDAGDPSKITVEKEAVVVNEDAIVKKSDYTVNSYKQKASSVTKDTILFGSGGHKARLKTAEPSTNNATAEMGYAAETGSPTGDIVMKSAPTLDVTVETKGRAKITVAPTESYITGVYSGVVVDSQGLPVPGVNVIIKGTQQGTQTDFDGKYSIAANPGDILEFSFVGMQSQTLALGKNTGNANIALVDDSNTLEDIVVESYRTTTRERSNVASTTVSSKEIERKSAKAERKAAKKEKEQAASALGSSITGTSNTAMAPSINNNQYAGTTNRYPARTAAVTTVTSQTIEGRPNASVIQSLEGQVQGVNITTGSAGDQVIIRGIGSVNGNIEPLYVIDGVPVNEAAFKTIDPNDIKDVNVIKGAGATSIYGSRGANGVIIVTTKNGLTKKQQRKLERLNKKLEKARQEQGGREFSPIEQQPVEVNQEDYESFVENQFENPATAPLSTFSIDVDNASYTNVRRFLNNGQSVPRDAVRVEEMINFFKYQYPQPKGGEPFSINTEYSDAPWNPKHKLLKIGLQGKEIPSASLPASNFVFLVDVSGSMNEANKLPLLQQSLKMLVNQMRSKDRIAIVVYAGAAGLVLPSTSGADKALIIAALDKLSAGGSTAGGAGIELAYKTAQENFIKDGNNRVILATDGDFNVGASSNTDMQTLIEEKRKSGVFLTCLGYGMGNYQDSKLEILSDKGNGNYAYIDNMQEADRLLQKEFKGSMYAIAKDVKIQIEFNPKHVQSYRLIGYENRKLRDEDFVNDAIDAGELGSGHTVTALYEIIPVGVKSDFFTATPELKYSQPTAASGTYNDELATIKFRHKKPAEDVSKETVKVIPNESTPLQRTSGDFKFSAAVAWFGLKLRDSKLVPNKKSDDIKALAKQGLQNDTEGYRAEFIRLVDMVE